jgi:hypothetical protein
MGASCTAESTQAPNRVSAASQPAPSDPAPDKPAETAPPVTLASTKLGSLSLEIPTTWQVVPTDGQMRKAEWKLPGDAGSVSLIAYHFGAGGAGMLEANLNRWKGQFEQDPQDNARVAKGGTAGAEWTMLEVRGRWVAETRPGSGDFQNLPGQCMLAAVVDASAGPYYLKAVGPEATLDRWRPALRSAVQNAKRQ